MTRACYAAALLVTLSACGGASAGLDLHFDTRASTWNDVVQRVMNAPSGQAAPALLLSISRSERPFVIARTETQHELWRSETTADATIHVAGASVLTVESGRLVVRDAATGRRSFVHPLSGMSLLGAARDRNVLAWISAAPSISTTQPRSRIVVADARDGTITWQRTIDAALGAPVLRGGIMIAPWNRQGLTAIDARDGRELARLHTDQISVDWVDATATGVVYGSNDVHDLACAPAAVSCVGLQSPFVHAPSHPALHRSGYRTPEESGIRTVYDVKRSPDGRLSYSDDRAYLIFYRYVFAYDSTGALSWVRMFDPDILNAQPFAAGLALVDASGRLTRLRASDGATLTESAPMGAWRSARWVGSVPGLSESERAVPAAPMSLQHGLLAMTLDADNRLVVARAFAAQTLGHDPDPDVTQQLLDAYEQRSTPSGLRDVIAHVLSDRRIGGEHLVSALGRHHDFLDDTAPAPLSIVVPALVAMNERRAVPALLAHLHDPATTADDLVVVAGGLERLADRTAAATIVDWLRSYRASRSVAGQPDVVTALARAAHTIAPPDVHSSLDTLARSADTEPVIAAALMEGLRSDEDVTRAAAERIPTNAPKTSTHGVDQRQINALFADRIDALRACIVPELARTAALAQIRIAFVVRPDGTLHGFAFAPSGATFADCMRPITQGLALAPFDGDSTLARYVIQLHASARPVEAAIDPTDAPAGEWWSWYARESLPTDGTPWWSKYVERDLDWLPAASAAAPTPVSAPVAPSQQPTHATPGTPSPATRAPAQAAPPPTPDDAWWLPSQP